MSETTKLAEVQARFIEEVQSKGILSVLQWISGWYASAASARLDDAIQDAMGEHRYNPEGLQLFLSRELISEAPRVFNKSSQDGANLMQQAYVGEVAARLRNVGGARRDEDWSTFCTTIRDQQNT